MYECQWRGHRSVGGLVELVNPAMVTFLSVHCPFLIGQAMLKPFGCFSHKLGPLQAVARNHSVTSEARQSPTRPMHGHQTIRKSLLSASRATEPVSVGASV